MTSFKLVYNPYTIEARLYRRSGAGEREIGTDSSLAIIRHERIQRWLAPFGSWRGFFQELRVAAGDKALKVMFYGTPEDYADLADAAQKSRDRQGIEATVEYALDDEAARQTSGAFKLARIREYLTAIQLGQHMRSLPASIADSIQAVVDPCFEINLLAPDPANKAALLNALLGRRLLPEDGTCAAADIVRVEIDDTLTDFTARRDGGDGQTKPVEGPLSTALAKRPAKDATALIRLEGPAPGLGGAALRLAFVDMPRLEDMNPIHREAMLRALLKQGLTLFVFDPGEILREDAMDAIRRIAGSVGSTPDSKVDWDRVLFVCTDCESIVGGAEQAERSIRQMLGACGIDRPRVFMVSARYARLLRVQRRGDALEAAERLNEADLEALRRWGAKLSGRDCGLYRFGFASGDDRATATARLNRLWDEADRLADQLDAAQDATDAADASLDELTGRLEAIREEIALINSGVPALETAILEYANRCAIPMKIRQFYLSVHGEAAAHASQAEYERHASERSLQNRRSRAEEVRREREVCAQIKSEMQKLCDTASDMDRLDEAVGACLAALDALKAPYAIRAEQRAIEDFSGLSLERSEAEAYARSAKDLIQAQLEACARQFDEFFEKDVLAACGEALSRYQARAEALVQYGDYRVRDIRFDAVGKGVALKNSPVSLDQFSAQQYEEVGAERIETQGAKGNLERALGKGGYQAVKDYAFVEYVFIEPLFACQVQTAKADFIAWTSEKLEALNAELCAMKGELRQKMARVDQALARQDEEHRALLEQIGTDEKKQGAAQDGAAWIDVLPGIVEQLVRI